MHAYFYFSSFAWMNCSKDIERYISHVHVYLCHFNIKLGIQYRKGIRNPQAI